MSGLCRSRYRGTASGSVKETSGEPENDRAGSGMYPDPGYQEVCRVRAGAENEEGCYEKHLYREQPFVIQRSASMLDDEWKNETVLVQGIIDAYFMEEDEIVLVDYKTDRVKRGQEQKLIDLYHVQLEDYARALERMTGKRVKEKIIYSFTLQKEILL